MEGCAGIASIIKSTLILENGIIPPVVGLKTVNPDIDAEFLNLKVRVRCQRSTICSILAVPTSCNYLAE